MEDDKTITPAADAGNPPADTGNPSAANPPADGGNPPAAGDGWQVPDGLTADMFDENHNLKLEAVQDLMKSKTDFEKQAGDLRKKVSTNATPKDVTEYAAAFKVDEKYQPYIGDDAGARGEFINATLENLDKIALEQGLTINQANALKAATFGLLEDTGMIPRGPEFMQAKQKEILGDNAEEIIKTNVQFVKDYGVFSPAEKEMLTLAAEQGNPLIVSVLDKVRVLFGKGKSADIPASTNSDGLEPDSILWEKYQKASDAEKMDIVQKRAAAGRPAKFGSIGAA